MSIQTLRIRVPANFPVNVSGNGGIVVSKTNGKWVVEPDFSQLATIVASAVADPTSKQIWIWDPVTDTYNVLTLAGLGDALYKTTSDTSLAIATGSKTFTIDSGKDYTVGDWILATSDADATNFMLGQITAYDSTSLTINVTTISGSGTHADWTIRASAAAGPRGRSAGYSYQWLTDTTASDPTAGFVKANNATFASITTLYISETDGDANALASELATWDDSTSTIKGRIKIYDPETPTNFMTFDLTARTDSGTYDTLTVTPVASGGSLTDSLSVHVVFIPKGDKGDTGAAGSGTISGATNHGVGIATGATAMTSTAALTDGQIVVGQTGADPLPKTISGDATLSAAGAVTNTKLNGVAAASYARLDTADQTLSGGANVTASSQGTKSSGTYTVDCGASPLQYITNGGAFTLAAPSSDGYCNILVTNNASAGAITFSGFTTGTTGDSLDTTSTHKFLISIVRINSVATYTVKALQ